MSRISVTRKINAPPDVVFRSVADIREFSKAVPGIVHYEFLSETQSGPGTRFRQTRRMSDGQEAKTELEVTEFVENSRIRMVTDDQHGTIWDTLFTVRTEAGGSVLQMDMDANSYKWLARIFVFSILGMVRRAVERDMDSVKAYCEQSGAELPKS